VTDTRAIASRGVPSYEPAPLTPLLPSPDHLDAWFTAAEALYRQGVLSAYVNAKLDSFGGVLALAGLDAETIRWESSTALGAFRDPVKERLAIRSRWSGHELAMRSAIAAGDTPENAIRAYVDRKTASDVEDLGTLQRLARSTSGTGAPMYAWQLELESTKARYRRLVNAPHDMPIGYTVAAVASLPSLPETPGELDHMLNFGEMVESVGGPFADAKGAGRHYATGTPRPAVDPWRPEPPPTTHTVVPEAVLDVSPGGASAWTGIDDAARGTARWLPAEPPGGRIADEVPGSSRITGPPATYAPHDVRFVNGSPVFEYPMLNLIYDPGPTALTLVPPWNTKYKFSKAGNLLALWESRWRRADGMSGSRRSALGYNIPSSAGFRTALNGHWEAHGLAKKLDPNDDSSWIMFDIELKQWFPEKEIDRGHIMSCVEHHMMMKQTLGDDGARDETAERRRKQYVHTFMHDFFNYVPQLEARNRGALPDGTYDGDYSDFRLGGDGITVLPGGETLRTKTLPAQP
jgi:hypothetical protein